MKDIRLENEVMEHRKAMEEKEAYINFMRGFSEEELKLMDKKTRTEVITEYNGNVFFFKTRKNMFMPSDPEIYVLIYGKSKKDSGKNKHTLDPECINKPGRLVVCGNDYNLVNDISDKL